MVQPRRSATAVDAYRRRDPATTFTQVMYPLTHFIRTVSLEWEREAVPQLGRKAITAAADRLREPAMTFTQVIVHSVQSCCW